MASRAQLMAAAAALVAIPPGMSAPRHERAEAAFNPEARAERRNQRTVERAARAQQLLAKAEAKRSRRAQKRLKDRASRTGDGNG